jgi:hypothetical protein
VCERLAQLFSSCRGFEAEKKCSDGNGECQRSITRNLYDESKAFCRIMKRAADTQPHDYP